jgi:hypothetical protein
LRLGLGSPALMICCLEVPLGDTTSGFPLGLSDRRYGFGIALCPFGGVTIRPSVLEFARVVGGEALGSGGSLKRLVLRGIRECWFRVAATLELVVGLISGDGDAVFM